MEGTTRILKSIRISLKTLRHMSMLGISAAVMVTLFLLLTGSETPIQAQSNTITYKMTLKSERESRGSDDFGYDSRHGSIYPDSFRYLRRSYDIDFIRWDKSDELLEFQVDDCIEKSEFVSLKLGSRTFTRSDIDWVEEKEGTCEGNRSDSQEFEFEDVARNPLPDGETVLVTLTLTTGTSSQTTVRPTLTNTPTPAGTPEVQVTATATPRPATVPCAVYSLGDASVNSIKYEGTWRTDCHSVSSNVPNTYRPRSYSRYRSFTLNRTSLVEINLESSQVSYPYLYLMSGNSSSGSRKATGNQQGGGITRIIQEFSPGTYTIEATTISLPGVKGIDFTLSLHAYPLRTRHPSGFVFTKRARHDITNGKEVYTSRLIQRYVDFSPYGVTLRGTTYFYLKTLTGCLDHRKLSVLSGYPKQKLSGTGIYPMQCPPNVGDAPESRYIWRVFRKDERFLHGPAYPNKSVTSMTVTADSHYTLTPMGSPYSIGWEVRFPMDPLKGDVQSFCLNCE